MNEKVLITKKGYELRCVKTGEGSTLRMGVDIYQVSKNGNRSVPISISRAEIVTGSKSLNKLLDFSICLDDREFKQVVANLKGLVSQIDILLNVDERATPNELYEAFCEYGKDKKIEAVALKLTEKIEILPKAFLTKGGLNIQTTQFENVMQEIEETQGYKKLEILKTLKFMGVLENGEGRAYDKKISVLSRKINCYRIMLPRVIDKEKGEESAKKEN